MPVHGIVPGKLPTETVTRPMEYVAGIHGRRQDSDASSASRCGQAALDAARIKASERPSRTAAGLAYPALPRSRERIGPVPNLLSLVGDSGIEPLTPAV